MDTYQINLRPELVKIIAVLAAREGCAIEAMIELLLEEKLASLQNPSLN